MGLIARFKAWRLRRLHNKAWPTLVAMCKDPQAARMWGRGLNHLWTDGGSPTDLDPARGALVLPLLLLIVAVVVGLGLAAWHNNRDKVCESIPNYPWLVSCK